MLPGTGAQEPKTAVKTDVALAEELWTTRRPTSSRKNADLGTRTTEPLRARGERIVSDGWPLRRGLQVLALEVVASTTERA